MRNAVKKLRLETSKEVVAEALPKVVSMIDKLAKKNVIHANKAANLKSSLVIQRVINSEFAWLWHSQNGF